MAYKDPPKGSSMNAPGCALVLLAMIGATAAAVALIGSPEGWWA